MLKKTKVLSSNELFFYWVVSQRSFLFAYVLDDYFCRGCLKNTSDTLMGAVGSRFTTYMQSRGSIHALDVAFDQPEQQTA